MDNNFRKDIVDYINQDKVRIQEDLTHIQEFKEQFYLSRGSKFIKQSYFVLLEVLAWVAIVAEIFWLIFLFRIPPFHKFLEMMVHVKNTEIYAPQDLDLVDWSIRGVVILLIIATFIISRLIAQLRRQNSKNISAGKGFTQLLSTEEKRLQALNALEQKYNYLFQNDIQIELEEFTNPLIPEPPKGDTYLDEEEKP